MVGLDSRIDRVKGKTEGQTQDGVRPAVNGKPGLPAPRTNQPITGSTAVAPPARETSKDLTHLEAARRVKQEYTHARKEPWMRGLDSVHGLLRQLMDDEPDINEVLKSTAKAIYTQFNVKEALIGLRFPDGVYRYAAMYGLSDQAWAAHQKLSYAAGELLDPEKYKWTDVSHHTKLFLAEENPYTEEDAGTRSEHLMSRAKRKTSEESIEGDYIDVFIYGPKDEVLGWIETSGTWDGKLPDARTIRSLEVFSSVLALAIVRHPPE